MISGDTIAAIATAPGRGGIAVVRVSGSEAFAIGERLTGRVGIGRSRQASISVGPIYSAPIGTCRCLSTPIDTGLLLAFKSPHSYTGEDVVEFQCHGGSVTPRRVLEACLAAGARLARRGEFTARAFLNGRIGYEQAASVLDLIDAKTVRAADAALEGLAGRRTQACRLLYEQALDLSTRLEHVLDIDEDELPADFHKSIHSSLVTLHSALRTARSKAAEGRLLKSGALVVLAGLPNAGKSSLLNALLEENRAIVSEIPGTTRDSIEAWIDLNGWPIRLVDTAGLREAKDEVEGEGVKRAEDLITKADLVLWLCEDAQAFKPASSQILKLHSKCDLGRGEGLNVSAKTGEGLEELKRTIVEKLEEKISVSDTGDSLADDIAAFDGALAILSPLIPNPQSPFPPSDLVLLANAMRGVAEKLGSAVGAVYSSDMLDNLFSRFCVGK